MKHTLNTAFHGIGYLCIMVGFIMCLAAAGFADLDGAIIDIMRYSVAGLATALTGLFLTWWKV